MLSFETILCNYQILSLEQKNLTHQQNCVYLFCLRRENLELLGMLAWCPGPRCRKFGRKTVGGGGGGGFKAIWSIGARITSVTSAHLKVQRS